MNTPNFGRLLALAALFVCATLAMSHYYFHFDTWLYSLGSTIRARSLLVSMVACTMVVAVFSWTKLGAKVEVPVSEPYFNLAHPLKGTDEHMVLEIRRVAHSDSGSAQATAAEAVFDGLVGLPGRWPILTIANTPAGRSHWDGLELAVGDARLRDLMLVHPVEQESVSAAALRTLHDAFRNIPELVIASAFSFHAGNLLRPASASAVVLSRSDRARLATAEEAKAVDASERAMLAAFRDPCRDPETNVANRKVANYQIASRTEWNEGFSSLLSSGKLSLAMADRPFAPYPMSETSFSRMHAQGLLGYLHTPRLIPLNPDGRSVLPHEEAVESVRDVYARATCTLPSPLKPTHLIVDAGSDSDVTEALHEALIRSAAHEAAPFPLRKVVDLREVAASRADTGSIGALTFATDLASTTGETVAVFATVSGSHAELYVITPARPSATSHSQPKDDLSHG